MAQQRRSLGEKKSPSIHSVSDPVGSVFNPRDLPKELTQGVDVQRDVLEAAQVDTFQVLYSWFNHRYPTMINKQDCKDMISDQSDYDDAQTRREMYYGGKLALIGYAMPFFIPRVTKQLHMKNASFIRYLESFVAESSFFAYQNMDDILEGKTDFVALPEDAQMSGFYVRTPVQIWNTQNKRVYKVPKWEKRTDLLKYLVIGNVNVYVMRKNLEDGFECYILFRGTSNAFNAVPQYGKAMENTQVYRVPQYDPIENKFYPEGSRSVPLFFYYYSDMIYNVMPHILQCLDWLHATDEGCHRIVVSGHSMGAALVSTFCYIWKLKHEELWRKTFFRSYAGPMCSNDAAVLKIEQWIIDSMQKDKYLEVVNTDDFVNVQYLLGGKKGLRMSIKDGTSQIGSWLVSNYWASHALNPDSDKEALAPPDDAEDGKGAAEAQGGKSEDLQKRQDTIQRMLRIIQVYPEVAFSAFMNGALASQIRSPPELRTVGTRLGQRPEEIKMWGSPALKEAYNGTLKVFFCQRRIQWQSEYLGKSHANYVDLNMNILWAPLRMYEDQLYRYYAKHGLRHNNRFRLVALFPPADAAHAKRLIRSYKPEPIKPRLLQIEQDLRKYEKKKRVKPKISQQESTRARHRLKRI
jgi:hypothetical protein